jgi:ADP-ribose pyrophosphatase
MRGELKPEKTISINVIHRFPKFAIEEAEVEVLNSKREKRWYVIKQDFVGVIPIDKQGNILLIREFRSAFGEIAWGIPGGSRNDGENPEEAARREMREEVGYNCKYLSPIIQSSSIFGTIKEKIYIYKAEGLFKAPLENDESEEIRLQWMKPQEVWQLILEGVIPGKIMAALIKLLRQLHCPVPICDPNRVASDFSD